MFPCSVASILLVWLVYVGHGASEAQGVQLQLSARHLNESAAYGASVVARLARLEAALAWAGVAVRASTPEHAALQEAEPAAEALRPGAVALVAARASQNLVAGHCPPPLATNRIPCGAALAAFNLSGTVLAKAAGVCGGSEPRVCTTVQLNSPFRPSDGSCNSDAVRPAVGRAATPYGRLLPARYLDGVLEPRRAVSRRPLPSARLVSVHLAPEVDLPPTPYTLALLHWTRFVAHDLTHTATSYTISSRKPIACCDAEGSPLAPRYLHPLCLPIPVPSDDPWYSSRSVSCLPYARSLAALHADCRLGPLDQLNQATHWLDGSHLYGPDEASARALREHRGGRLAALEVGSGPSDPRADHQPHIAALHVAWTREHNRLTTALSDLNPHWGDERLYQEARRIVIAQLQHITYNEWLPLVLGTKPTADLSAGGWEPNTDPTVANSFATAALSWSHSLAPALLCLMNENRVTNYSLQLRDWFGRGSDDFHEPERLDFLLRGLVTQRTEPLDRHIVADLTQHLFGGLDALALDVQRGRDHGLPPYLDYRAACDLSPVSDWSDLKPHIPDDALKALRLIYSDVRDVDLVAGLLAERAGSEGLLGPTAACLLTEQLRRTRHADRRFYTHPGAGFSPAQANQLTKASLARVLCDNGDNIRSMQHDAFSEISLENPLVDCKDIEGIELTSWREPPVWENNF